MRIAIYISLCLIWGSTWKAIQVGLAGAPPLSTAAVRFLVAMSILVTIALVRGYAYPARLKDWLHLAFPGLWMYGISYALIYFAEQYISSALTAVLFGSFPFWVAGLSYFRLKDERLPAVGWLGILIGFTGVILISYDQLQISGDLFLGTMLALGGCYAAAHGVVIHKKRFVHDNIVVSASVQMLLGGILLVSAALIFESLGDFSVSWETLGSIAYLALFGTVFAFLSYYWLLRRMNAVTLSLIAFVTPIVAIAIGIFAGEEITLTILIGTALILSGILLVVRKEPLPVDPDPDHA